MSTYLITQCPPAAGPKPSHDGPAAVRPHESEAAAQQAFRYAPGTAAIFTTHKRAQQFLERMQQRQSQAGADPVAWQAQELAAMDFLRWLLTARDCGIEQFLVNPPVDSWPNVAADGFSADEPTHAPTGLRESDMLAISIEEILAGLAEQVTTAVTERQLAARH